MHKTLERQLRRLGLRSDASVPPTAEQWNALLDRVDRTYCEADQERYTLERSISVSSEEMMQLYDRITAEHEQLLALVRARAASEAQLRSLAHAMPLGLVHLDLGGFITDANPAAMRVLGLEHASFLGRTLDELLPPHAGDAADEAAERGPFTERRFVRADGRIAWIHSTEVWLKDDEGNTTMGTSIFRDFTAQKELEISLRQAQKLESVGRLASGVAHELNTPTQFVNDNVCFLQSSFESVTTLVCELSARVGDPAAVAAACEIADWDYLVDEIPRSISQSIDGLKRIATIVSSMKNFAHNDRGEMGPTDLNAVLANTLVVARHELKMVAETVEEYGELPSVMCSRTDLGQVFLNLVVNAAHAVGDAVKGTSRLGEVRVSTRVEDETVVIAIADTGAGIPEHVKAHLFEPFFTTKEVGRGTGQGLALARNVIVQKHGGTLEFESTEGVGTTFLVRLPIAGAKRSARAA